MSKISNETYRSFFSGKFKLQKNQIMFFVKIIIIILSITYVHDLPWKHVANLVDKHGRESNQCDSRSEGLGFKS